MGNFITNLIIILFQGWYFYLFIKNHFLLFLRFINIALFIKLRNFT